MVGADGRVWNVGAGAGLGRHTQWSAVDYMNDAMFEMPSENVKEFTVTLDYAKAKLDKANLHKLQLQ